MINSNTNKKNKINDLFLENIKNTKINKKLIKSSSRKNLINKSIDFINGPFFDKYISIEIYTKFLKFFLKKKIKEYFTYLPKKFGIENFDVFKKYNFFDFSDFDFFDWSHSKILDLTLPSFEDLDLTDELFVKGGYYEISNEQCLGILCAGMLCLLELNKSHKNPENGGENPHNTNLPNFYRLYSIEKPEYDPNKNKGKKNWVTEEQFDLQNTYILETKIEKLKCLKNYFIINKYEKIKNYNVKFIYKKIIMNYKLSLDYFKSDVTKINTYISNGSFEDHHSIPNIEAYADFANKRIGGGVLGKGAVQEEIEFITHPDTIVSKLFFGKMENEDSIQISGYRKYSNHSEYGSKDKNHFKFNDKKVDFDSIEFSQKTLVAMDSIKYYWKPGQYNKGSFDREIIKCLSAFYAPTVSDFKRIITGNWGSGVFGSDVVLKFLIQYLCASYWELDFYYYYFDNSEFEDFFFDQRVGDFFNSNPSQKLIYGLISDSCAHKKNTPSDDFSSIVKKKIEKYNNENILTID